MKSKFRILTSTVTQDCHIKCTCGFFQYIGMFNPTSPVWCKKCSRMWEYEGGPAAWRALNHLGLPYRGSCFISKA